MEAFAKGAASAIIAYTTHYTVAKLYDSFCVPDGILGFVKGLLTTGSPLCRAGIEIMNGTQLSYSNILLLTMTRMFVDWTSKP